MEEENHCALCNNKLGSLQNKARNCATCGKRVCKKCVDKNKVCFDCVDKEFCAKENQKIKDALGQQAEELKELDAEMQTYVAKTKQAEVKKNDYKSRLQKEQDEQIRLKEKYQKELTEGKEGYNKLMAQNEALTTTLTNSQDKLFELEKEVKDLTQENLGLQKQQATLREEIDAMHSKLSMEVQRTHSLQAELNNMRTYSLDAPKKGSRNPRPIEQTRADGNQGCARCSVF